LFVCMFDLRECLKDVFWVWIKFYVTNIDSIPRVVMTIIHRYAASRAGPFTRFDVLTAVENCIVIFFVMTHVFWSVDVNLSKELTSSVFRN
jgi:hypothetical protein